MKLFIGIALALSFSSLAFSQSHLLQAECTGTYEDGGQLSIHVHVDPSIFCSEKKNEFETLLVIKSKELNQEIFKGITHINREAETSEIRVNQDLYGKMVDIMTLQYDSDLVPAEIGATYKIVNDFNEETGAVSYETVKMSCSMVEYYMDCDNEEHK